MANAASIELQNKVREALGLSKFPDKPENQPEGEPAVGAIESTGAGNLPDTDEANSTRQHRSYSPSGAHPSIHSLARHPNEGRALYLIPMINTILGNMHSLEVHLKRTRLLVKNYLSKGVLMDKWADIPHEKLSACIKNLETATTALLEGEKPVFPISHKDYVFRIQYKVHQSFLRIIEHANSLQKSLITAARGGNFLAERGGHIFINKPEEAGPVVRGALEVHQQLPKAGTVAAKAQSKVLAVFSTTPDYDAILEHAAHTMDRRRSWKKSFMRGMMWGLGLYSGFVLVETFLIPMKPHLASYAVEQKMASLEHAVTTLQDADKLIFTHVEDLQRNGGKTMATINKVEKDIDSITVKLNDIEHEIQLGIKRDEGITSRLDNLWDALGMPDANGNFNVPDLFSKQLGKLSERVERLTQQGVDMRRNFNLASIRLSKRMDSVELRRFGFMKGRKPKEENESKEI